MSRSTRRFARITAEHEPFRLKSVCKPKENQLNTPPPFPTHAPFSFFVKRGNALSVTKNNNKKKQARARAHTHTHTIYTFFFLKRKYPDLFTKKQLVTDSSHTFFAFPPASDDDALCEGCEWSDSFFTINVQSLKAGHTWAKKVNKWKIKTQNKDLLNGLQQMRKFSVETLQANWRLYTKKLALSLQTSLPADGKPGQILFY